MSINFNRFAVGNNALLSIKRQGCIFSIDGYVLLSINSRTTFYSNRGSSRKFIGAIILTNVRINILSIRVLTRQAAANAILQLLVVLRLSVPAYTSFFIKSDDALLVSSNTGGCQTRGNHHITGKLSFAIHITTIRQLACQSIHCCFYSFIISQVNIIIAGCQNNLRTASCMLNGYITADIIRLLSTIIIMLVNDCIITAEISNIQLHVTVLINEATIINTFAANQLVNIGRTIEVIIARSAIIRHIAGIQTVSTRGGLMRPLCTIAQPDIYFASLRSTCVINNALPGRFLSGQADVDTAILINVRLICTLGAFCSYYVTDNIRGLALSCYEVFILQRVFIITIISVNNVNVNRTAVAGHCIICFLEAAICISFVRRSFNFYEIANQTNSRQFASKHFIIIFRIGIRLYRSTAYSNINIAIYSNIGIKAANAKRARLPACTCIVFIAAHRGYATRTDVAMYILSNNAPRTVRIILAHFHITINY